MKALTRIQGMSFDRFRIDGTYAGNISISSAQLIQTAPGVPMQIGPYIPPVDCWAHLHCHVGQIQKTDAIYNYSNVNLRIDGAAGGNAQYQDVGGLGTGAQEQYYTQRSDVDIYGARDVHYIFDLGAGLSYLFNCKFDYNGGTWVYYAAKDYVFLEAIMFAK